MIKVYRKTGIIKAEQFDCSDVMVNRYGLIDRGGHIVDGLHVDNMCFVPTLEGKIKINIHDWIATGKNGEHWPISDDVFKQTYAELPVIPEKVGEILQSAHGKDTLLGVLETAKSGNKISEPLEWIIVNQDAFARAWLDCYQVED